jgi:hypothetical protein
VVLASAGVSWYNAMIQRRTPGKRTLISTDEKRILEIFRQFMIRPGQMLCFYGQDLKKYKPALRQLTEQGLLVQERFRGGYSLTQAGFAAMEDCK